MHRVLTVSATVLLLSCGSSNGNRTETVPVGDENHAENGALEDAEDGRALADSIMAQWSRQHPDRSWEEEVRRSHPNIPEPFDNREILPGEGQVDTYGQFTEQELATWKRESEKLVLEGARVFHSGDDLGSTVAVSCDMCHPDAANTHPETYPKFQVQMGRVAHLRDMINWCLINPLRAPAMAPDDPRMRALEAYILAQRKGTPLNYGKY